MSTSAFRRRQDRPRSLDVNRRRKRAAAAVAGFEVLEPRALLATLLVTTNVDTIDPSDNALSLREAIEVSNGTRPRSSLSPAEQGLVFGSLSAPAPNSIFFEAPQLRLLGTYNLASDLPSAGDSRVDISTVQGIGRYARIFSASGQMTYDGPLSGLVFGQNLVDLNLLLDGLYAKAGLTQADVDNVFKYTFLANNTLLPMYITPASALPTITAPAQIIGGGTVNPVDQPNVNLGNPYTRIDGRGLISDGLVVEAANCTFGTLILTGFTATGISIQGPSAQGNSLFNSFLGTLPSPLTGRDFSNAASLRNGIGLYIAASNNRIGGNTPGLPNVIANNGIGVRITKPLGTGTLVQGNFILDNLAQGVYIDSSNNTIGEALAGGGNVISGNGEEGVLITGGPDVQGNNLLGNLIGTDIGVVGGNPPKGAYRRPNGKEGVKIDDSPKNIIGGNNDAARNVIGGNNGDGVLVTGPNASGNRVQGNWIGFNIVNGLVSLDLPNNTGVVIQSPGNNVGGSNAGEGNVISLNRAHGVLIQGNLASGSSVLGNTIGLNPDRGSDFGNTLDGVHVVDAANTLIGGTTEGARNYISGNNHGIMLEGVLTTGTRIEGNFIGTAGDGKTDLGNAVNGVYILGGPLNTIGGTATGAGNVISGNNRGVVISGSDAKNNKILGNFIGTDLAGLAIINNEIDGVLINNDASFTAIGGTLAGEFNTIAFNAGDGVRIDSGVGNAIRSNLIHDNRGLGIALNVANAANALQPTPALTSADPQGTRVLVRGTLNAAPGSYEFDFFATTDKGPSGNGQLQPYQAQRYLGRARLTIDASHAFAYELPTLVTSSEWITVTATDAQGNTSEISNAVRVPTRVQFSAASYAVEESLGAIVITVNRTGGLGGGISVAYATVDGTAVAGTDYTAVNGTLFFLSNDAMPQTFTIPILHTAKIGGSTTFTVMLSDATNGASLGTPSSTTVTINDDDQGFKFSALNTTVSEAAGSVTLQVTRPSGVGAASVDYATANGTAIAGVNYVAKSGTITFAPGETSKPLTIPLIGDNLITGPLGFTVALANPVGALIEPPGTVSVTINNADTPGVIAFAGNATTVPIGATSATVTVKRTVGKGGTVSVAYATSGGTAVAGVDYLPASGVLTFGPGETSKSFVVTILNPASASTSSNVNVTLSSPTGGATLGSIISTSLRIQRSSSPAPGPGTPGTPTGDVVAPTVVSFAQSGSNAIVIGFSEPLDRARAENLANYGGFVTSYGRDNIPNTRDDSNIAIVSASYDAAGRKVTLRLATSLSSGLRYYVTLNRDAQSAPGRGIADLSGNLLAGDGRTAGTPYTGTIGTTTTTTTTRAPVSRYAPTSTRGRTTIAAPTRGSISARSVDSLSVSSAFPRVGSLSAWSRRR